ncbi:MAG: sigma-70 family RNA polymerase sigma factor [Elusimicrobia bacterium]|nr:sigma-70 family RNA polymerase sigma factor [Elusimicrobiota bacterium]
MEFTELYDRYFAKVYNYVRYHVRLAAEADDITGRIFEAALGGYDKFDPSRGPEQAWLFGIARNAVADWGRGRSRRGEVALDAAAEREGTDPRPEAAFELREREARLLEAVAGLDERARDIIALKFSSGMNNREIAKLTGLGESNIGIIIYRAVKKMQASLEGKL